MALHILADKLDSPSQAIKELKDKIRAYFDLGFKSCWLMIPDVQLVSIYAKQGGFRNFDMRDTEVIDEVMDIQLPIQKAFGKRPSTANY